jgi:hypothetical protein
MDRGDMVRPTYEKNVVIGREFSAVETADCAGAKHNDLHRAELTMGRAPREQA